MKTTGLLFSILLAITPGAQAQTNGGYTNFIRQIQLPSGVEKDMTNLEAAGTQDSALAINPGGARFELHSVNTVTATPYLLVSQYVASYVPTVDLVITSEDPYDIVPRTRADRPFYVKTSVTGLLSGATDPEAAKKVNFLRHVQSYGEGGTGVGIDTTQATLLSQSYIESSAVAPLPTVATMTFAINAVPGADRAKIRGEERFSVFSLADERIEEESGQKYSAPAAQLASQRIQIWPVADGALTGITAGQLIRFKMPPVTVTLNDLYPDSHTYVQVYKGPAQLGMTGKKIPESRIIMDSTPQDEVFTLTNYDSVFGEDGEWTMELVTKTPFGLDRLAHVTFNLDLTLQMNGSVTTIDN